MAHATCSIDGCERRVRNCGWCSPHYRRWREHGDPLAGAPIRVYVRGAICSVDGCETRSAAHGLCPTHLARLKKHGDPLRGAFVPAGSKHCSVEGCDRAAAKRGWCIRHYRRWQRHGDPTAGRVHEAPPYVGQLCGLRECDQPAVKRGWCALHYARWRIHGDAEWLPRYGEMTSDFGGDYRIVSVPCRGAVAVVLIDEVDWERFGGYRWHVARAGYVIVALPGIGRRGPGVKGRGSQVGLHRLIMERTKGDGLVVDHVNGERADNRRSNLRVVTQSANAQNKRGYGKYSPHRGVSFDRSRQRWVAYLKIPGARMKHLGSFVTEDAAAAVAAAARAEYMPYAVAGR